MKEREKLKSRMGFILISAGCAIGIGNVWKFPYIAGKGGGGAFVLCYLIFLVILGLPVMTMEFAVGRASQKSPVKAYQALEKPGQKWHIHGYITVIGCYLLMMFYTTVSGWMLHYFYLTATGKFTGLDADQVGGVFNEMLSQPLVMAFWMIVVVAIGIFVCSRGLQNGLEKITKVMMIALLAIMVVLAINSIMMDGAAEGLKFYLIPDFERPGYRLYHCSSDESGILYPESWYRSHGNLRKLYRKGKIIAWGICKYCDSGYICGNRIRSDHFSGMLYLRSKSDIRTEPDLYHPAEYLQPYSDGKTVGKFVLYFYDLCGILYSTGSF